MLATIQIDSRVGEFCESDSLKRKMYLRNGFPDLDLSMVSNGDDASRRIIVVLLYSSYVMKYDVA
jgi:hypothetical protein